MNAPKVVILCGGQGTRLREETEFRPKPMVEVGGRPLLFHIMKLYEHHGLNEFVLCLGYRGSIIKEYFLNYRTLNGDCTVDLRSGTVELEGSPTEDWRVTLAETGEDAMTGARISRVARHVGNDDVFCCTYGDGLADVDVSALLDFHRAHGKVATVTGVVPPGRFGQLRTSGAAVQRFAEKPTGRERINGGFFVFSRSIFDVLSDKPSCVLEREPLEQLAAAGELMVYEHDGFWQCADTLRDVELLRGLWDGGAPPWRVWDAVRAPLAA